ncbi:hypothetical protein ACFFUB_11800 [Algimonas porphyrae]|uniref:UrcA family protein n=1 Tax=Algimonas porphyrae TaxID=1128113 RepID=A0ABQ5UXH1_9PROT|nr:hypothetical protein [Algimonas porphyrae]GLQ19094.1 hypothetical protein GCM10007854_00490 [Algimonas porphyrae]
MKAYIKGGLVVAGSIVFSLTAGADVNIPDRETDFAATLTSAQAAQLAAIDRPAEMSMIERNFHQNRDETQQSYKRTASLLMEDFCYQVAHDMCVFMLNGPLEMRDTFYACMDHYQDQCMQEFLNPAEEIGGQ